MMVPEGDDALARCCFMGWREHVSGVEVQDRPGGGPLKRCVKLGDGDHSIRPGRRPHADDVDQVNLFGTVLTTAQQPGKLGA